MATRLSVFAASAAISTAVAIPLLPTSAQAQGRGTQDTQPDVENSRFRFEGRINAQSVYVRSGPSENYYETDRLPVNTTVIVVGHKFDWLKILPPAESFSLVAKASIDLAPDGRTGRAKTDNLSVRAGSRLNPMKATIQSRLKVGDTVQIIDSVDEYYKIVPPADAYFYVHQRYVTPVRQLDASSTVAAQTQRQVPPAMNTPLRDVTAIATEDLPGTETNEAAPAAEAETETIVAAPTTQPIKPVEPRADHAADFERLETQWNATQAMGIEQFPAAELLAGYETLLSQPKLPPSIQRIAQVRAASLRIRNRAKQEFLATMQQQQEAMNRIEALRAQRQIVEKRLEANVAYTAIGTLQPSTLQLGKLTLYRLTDPATGRTLCYVRTEDAKFISLIGSFVGVRGDLATDSQLALKVVNATELETIEPARVNKGVTAQISPPSLTSASAAEAASVEEAN